MAVEQHLLVVYFLLAEGLPVVVNILRQGILVHPMVEIRKHRGAVNADPMEQIVWEHVGVIPAQLSSHEITYAAMPHNLRKRCTVAEGIRQPFNVRGFAEFLQVEPLAVEHLAHQRFPARDVEVRLHPHAADKLPAAFADSLFDLGEQSRIIVLEIFEQLRLALGKLIFRVFLH
ncbi:hypothetical protein D3C75_743990 [compost metagenome]